MGKEVVEEQIWKTEKVFEEANQALNGINTDMITEIMSYNRPHQWFEKIADMIVLLLTRNRKPDWDSFKKLAEKL